MSSIDTKLEQVKNRFEELERLLCLPETLADSNRLRDLSRERASLEGLVSRYAEYRRDQSQIQENESMLKGEKDPEFRAYLESELRAKTQSLQSLERELTVMLLPKDENAGKSVLMEIRAGTGGEEAALFAGQLLRMYTRYAERNAWKVELMNVNATGLGGIKEAVFGVQGKTAWSHLKYESGVHRVQRVPETEAGGRVHTSTATVAVLPEAADFEVNIREGDLKMDTYRASGAGGQHVNKTESAVRITHLPTGLIVACQDERSQHQNREKAMRILRAHLYEMAQKKQEEEQGKMRKSQVGTGERSEKIRTYNFPQSRITDHRLGESFHNIQEIMDGGLDKLTETLQKWEEKELLEKNFV